MGSITIVGLGPGDARLLTRAAWERLTTVTEIYLRTGDHPAVRDLPAHIVRHTFDHLYATQTAFEAVYAAMVEQLLDLGAAGDITYAVPGHPYVGESTVLTLIRQAPAAGIGVEVVAGLSFLEPVLATVGVDALDGLQIYDAIDLAGRQHPVLMPDVPLLLGQVFNRLLASDLKLTLMQAYPDEHQVYLVHNAGAPDQIVEHIPLYAIDHSQHIRNLTALYVPPLPMVGSLPHFAETIAILRSPQGCPWDREQTPQSLRAGFVEEVAEALDALDRQDAGALREELGDVLLHVVMQAQIASEQGEFTLTDVIAGVDAKIKRRHPHVWGDAIVTQIEQILSNWETIKAHEKPAATQSLLDNIPLALPALARAQKIQQRVRRIGFDWLDVAGVWDKLHEEMKELRHAATPGDQAQEMGDVLFTLVNLARWLELDAESSLREANGRFTRRFQRMEELAHQRGLVIDQLGLDALESLWQEAKRALRA